jgi:hypothetical protein
MSLPYATATDAIIHNHTTRLYGYESLEPFEVTSPSQFTSVADFVRAYVRGGRAAVGCGGG